MKTNKKQVLLALGALLLGSFLSRPAAVFAGPYENLRAQSPITNINPSAIRNYAIANLPTPMPGADAETARAAAANPLPNFVQVSPALYRSGQPTQAGVAKLAATGIKTIIKLNTDSPAEADWAAGAGIDLETILMSNKVSPTYDQIDQALAIINDPAKQPVVVHCHLGHDRTGAVVGAYRVTVQGWTVDKAAAEAKAMGYSAPGFQNITTYLQGYLAHTQQRAAITRDAGSAQPNWSITPGNLCTPSDPNFKEYRYPEHIAYCNRNVTQQMKQQIAASYNVPQSDWHNYEFDHLIPLCIGGDSSIDNLWPQPRGPTESDGKDKLENQLFKEMSAGTITQKAAVQQIYDWFKGYAARHPELSQTMRTRLATLGN
jgi:protein tyrosine/serine phosphatase